MPSPGENEQPKKLTVGSTAFSAVAFMVKEAITHGAPPHPFFYNMPIKEPVARNPGAMIGKALYHAANHYAPQATKMTSIATWQTFNSAKISALSALESSATLLRASPNLLRSPIGIGCLVVIVVATGGYGIYHLRKSRERTPPKEPNAA